MQKSRPAVEQNTNPTIGVSRNHIRPSGTLTAALALLCLAAAAPIRGDMPAPQRPYILELDDSLVFVMMTGNCVAGDQQVEELVPVEEKDAWIKKISETRCTGRDDESYCNQALPCSERPPHSISSSPIRLPAEAAEAGEPESAPAFVRITYTPMKWRLYAPGRRSGGSWDENTERQFFYPNGEPRYERPGLYRRDDPANPLWTVDWYAHNVRITRDGKYMVRPWGPFAGWDSNVLSFYRKGALLRSYRMQDLVTDRTTVTRTVSFSFWQGRYEQDPFNEAELTYTVVTAAGDRYVMSLETGEIISEERPPEPRFTARVRTTTGSKVRVNRLHLCGASSGISQILHRNASMRYTVSAYREFARRGRAADILMIWIPFHDLATVRRDDSGANDEALTWNIELKQGDKMAVQVDPRFNSFCGVDDRGQEVELQAAGIQRLEFLEEEAVD